MLEIRFDGVSQEFEGREVLHQVTCSFHAGRVTAIAGANGSGKSTLLRIAARLMLPSSGTVDTIRDGAPVGGAEYRSMLSMATPEMELYTRLTVRENLSFLLSARGAACGEEELKALTARVGLSPEVLSRTAGQLSTGMRQRVRLAALLGVDAEIWLLDEPGLALDERGRALLMNEVRRAAERGRLVLWATNDREEREAADACIDLSCGASGCL
jgi:sulfate/thiosulfate ABC superfamily ATP binding cassette transporter, ABC protein